MFLESHFDIIEGLKVIFEHRDIYYAKIILNSFVCVEVRILVEKWNVLEGHIFSMPLLQTSRLETTSLFLNTLLLVKKNFQILFFILKLMHKFAFMCSPRNDKYNPSYSKNKLSIKSLLRTWFLCFSRFYFFHIWGAEKHVFHIFPFCPTRYVLKIFRCLDVSNRVRNWNKVKNNIYVRWKIQLCQLEIPIFIKKFMCQCSLINSVSFVFYEFNWCSELKWKQNYHISTIISNSQLETLVSYWRSTNVNVNMSFPTSNFEGALVLMYLAKTFWHYRELKIYFWTSRHILCEKNITFFRIFGV